ncbi:ABC transporter substrate-binding protein [Erysipelothrix sp. HDW6C]|uniref:ABC transporter substrate-binding protein n=1 Tax=Erysipelothrix sp. HDW6C TaxID=2714930 RepID=UPI0014084C67|nr:ABC transporter substrate-binding protein [Erysipelothrix sp. HDW6C]QIK70544.1 ABC transporter substrate-binding protein [Erysipelothrix sp. HDW6C]
MKRYIFIIFALLIITGCAPSSQQSVGVLQFGDFASLTDTYEGFAQVMAEHDIAVVYKNANADASTLMLNAQSLSDNPIDGVFAITTQATQAVINVFEGQDTPIVFGAVSDPASLGIELQTLGGVSDVAPYREQFALIQTLTPQVKRIGMVYRTGDVNGVYQIEQVKTASENSGFEIVERGVNDAQELAIALPSLVREVDAIYLITDDLNVSNTAMIVDGATKAEIPVYATEDGQFEEGILASVSISYTDLGRQAGEMMVKALNGEPVSIDLPRKVETKINGEVAQIMKLEVPDDLKTYIVE